MKAVVVARVPRSSNHRIIVPIRNKYKDEYLDIFRTSRYAALCVILDDVGIHRLGLKPKFISIDTAKRLDLFFTPNTSYCTGVLTDFFRLESLTL